MEINLTGLQFSWSSKSEGSSATSDCFPKEQLYLNSQPSITVKTAEFGSDSLLQISGVNI